MKWRKHGRHTIAASPTLPGVWRVKEGGYYARTRVLDPRTGKQREVSRAGFDDAHAAFAWLEEERRRIRAGIEVKERQRTRLSNYAASLAERKAAAGEIRSAKTKRTWADNLTLHILPALGDYYLDGLARADIEAWKAKIAPRFALPDGDPKRLSPVTANGWLRVLRVVINTAAQELELERNPILGVKDFDTSTVRTYTVEEPNSLHPEDVPRFLEAMRAHWPQHFAMVLLGVATGLRPSSMRPLRRKGPTPDLLLEKAVLIVRRSHTMRDEVMEKTKTSLDQVLALPQDLVEVLRQHADGLEGVMAESDLLFPSETGGFRSQSCLDKPFKDVVKRLKLPYKLTPRGMRRTFNDLARAAEVKDIVTRAVSGHQTEAMQRHYSTVAHDEMRAGIAKVIQLAGYRRATAG